MRHYLPFVAAIALSAPQIAAAAQPTCITQREAGAIAAYALPSALSGVVERCGPALDKESFTARSGPQMVLRYADRKAAAWPEAKSALLKMAASGEKDGMMDLVKALPDNALQQIVDPMLTGIVGEKLPASRCAVIDRYLSLLAPLPPENTAELIALTLDLLSREEKKPNAKFQICKA